MDVACGGSITSKTARVAYQVFEELAKHNYQAPLERSLGMKPTGLLEIDKISSL